MVYAGLTDACDLRNALCRYLPLTIQIGKVEHVIDELQKAGTVLFNDMGIFFSVIVIAEVTAENL